jgi:xanthine dehydrogenase accessory factor
MTTTPSALAKACLDTRESFAIVTISDAAGSTPRETGVAMVVSLDTSAGTIGGGRLEWNAIQAARDMLRERSKRKAISVALGPAIGQCCGGRVTLMLEPGEKRHVQALREQETRERAARPLVMIYGAGHVGRALVQALALLPFRITLIDSRAGELERVSTAGVEMILTDASVALAEKAPEGSAHVVMTHSHALDCQIAAAVLERDAFRYLGIIGSKTKKASFRKAFRAIGLTEERIGRVVCPIGGGSVRDKRPEVIAALAAAEIATALLARPKGSE